MPIIDYMVGFLEVDLPEEDLKDLDLDKDLNDVNFTRMINREF